MERTPRPYGHVAWCYDAAAAAYSLGAIGRAKRRHVGRLNEGDRVLYVGAGTGREVAAACRAQPTVEVICVEPCAAMARRLRRRLAPWAERVTIVEESLRAAEGEGAFDCVCGHFFFNVFDVATMPKVLAMAASHVRPGGRMVVADFAAGLMSRGREGMDKHTHQATTEGPLPHSRGLLLDSAGSFMRAAYYRPVNVAGWALRMCALHPIFDYGPMLEGMGFAVEGRVGFPGMLGMPALYEVICARKEQGG